MPTVVAWPQRRRAACGRGKKHHLGPLWNKTLIWPGFRGSCVRGPFSWGKGRVKQRTPKNSWKVSRKTTAPRIPGTTAALKPLLTQDHRHHTPSSSRHHGNQMWSPRKSELGEHRQGNQEQGPLRGTVPEEDPKLRADRRSSTPSVYTAPWSGIASATAPLKPFPTLTQSSGKPHGKGLAERRTYDFSLKNLGLVKRPEKQTYSKEIEQASEPDSHAVPTQGLSGQESEVTGTFLGVQCLKPCASRAGVQLWSLVREQRFPNMSQGVIKKIIKWNNHDRCDGNNVRDQMVILAKRWKLWERAQRKQ